MRAVRKPVSLAGGCVVLAPLPLPLLPSWDPDKSTALVPSAAAQHPQGALDTATVLRGHIPWSCRLPALEVLGVPGECSTQLVITAALLPRLGRIELLSHSPAKWLFFLLASWHVWLFFPALWPSFCHPRFHIVVPCCTSPWQHGVAAGKCPHPSLGCPPPACAESSKCTGWVSSARRHGGK